MSRNLRPISTQKVIAILKKAGHTQGKGDYITTWVNGFNAHKTWHPEYGPVVIVTHRDERGNYGKFYDDSAEYQPRLPLRRD
ncbi:hypothetical protein [Symbiobacterium thermophilum]|uniref:hypothetical protein n=1 Tax=Symbiobacterium thermophilum TaxID=2734 RepID=UPI0005BBE58D|nr:hypothetical protein [Symbiobacterium thermophilum]